MKQFAHKTFFIDYPNTYSISTIPFHCSLLSCGPSWGELPGSIRRLLWSRYSCERTPAHSIRGSPAPASASRNLAAR
jgi:hypothetical protein